MIHRYRKSHEKIAMGLLAYMPQERNVKQLKKTMALYNERPNWQLFFWKADNYYVGIIGIHVEDDEFFTVQHISVLPSFRGEGIGHEMIVSVGRVMGNRQAKPSKETKNFMTKCSA
ncbi:MULTISPECIES: GNAT family N-acetyltransferase [Planococcus]|uniref:GNAT family N-acetyltransferase n=1 Tax=Planococcus faecalis TaxID=1598147 RepID=A0ABM6IW22_9BACL|nr:MULTISPECIES: GNAT family N-acetyltransferase [Planococcus]AQU80792.1 GNAT family N-acetyltransferase [Planococcus faecalis]MDJ0332009.1 GNAT family N-acetyltransferase [Planococcus sp. S3-L1]OHX55778.1 acetyltransferase [Planococcus faecalis]